MADEVTGRTRASNPNRPWNEVRIQKRSGLSGGTSTMKKPIRTSLNIVISPLAIYWLRATDGSTLIISPLPHASPTHSQLSRHSHLFIQAPPRAHPVGH